MLLVGAGTLTCRLDGLAIDHSPSQERIEWVRTVHGWERPEAWAAVEVSELQLHPLVVAAGQALLSVLALAVFATDSLRRSAETATT
jgi:hypothetical protein